MGQIVLTALNTLCYFVNLNSTVTPEGSINDMSISQMGKWWSRDYVTCLGKEEVLSLFQKLPLG